MKRIAMQRTVRTSQETPDIWLLLGAYSALYVTVNHLLATSVIPDVHWDAPWAGLDVQPADVAERRKRWQLIGYAVTPIGVVIRIGFSAVCLTVGTILADWKVSFSELFRAAATAECVWAVGAVVHLACLLYVIEIESLADYAAFYPLSVGHFVNLGEEDLWLSYLVKSMNVFEVVYAFALALAARTVIGRPVRHVVMVVLAAYGSAMLLLVATVTFALMALT